MGVHGTGAPCAAITSGFLGDLHILKVVILAGEKSKILAFAFLSKTQYALATQLSYKYPFHVYNLM